MSLFLIVEIGINHNGDLNIAKKIWFNKNLATSFESLLKKEKFNSIRKLFHELWQIKIKLPSKVSNNYLDNIYLSLMKQ